MRTTAAKARTVKTSCTNCRAFFITAEPITP